MKEIFNRFNGNKVRIALNSGTTILEYRTGYLEVQGEWALLYVYEGQSKVYKFAISMAANNILSIETLVRG